MAGDPDFDVGFLRQEWEQVVQANGIQTAGRLPARCPARAGAGR